ncbi:hypothetical protein RM545_17565, partial [Zunongwangia sp. F260]|nr:hypothetical protein [Zunongwangia sp. F260]
MGWYFAGATNAPANNCFATAITAAIPGAAKEPKLPGGNQKTIAGRLIRELERKLAPGEFAAELDLFKKKVLAQEKNSKNKIYSLHEPEVY